MNNLCNLTLSATACNGWERVKPPENLIERVLNIFVLCHYAMMSSTCNTLYQCNQKGPLKR